MFPDPYFYYFLLLDHTSGTIRNILMVHGRIIEQVNMECHMQEWQLCLSSFSDHVPSFLFFVYGGSLCNFHKILILFGSIIEQANMEC